MPGLKQFPVTAVQSGRQKDVRTSPLCFLTFIGNQRLYWLSSRSIDSPASPFSTPENKILRLTDTMDTKLNRSKTVLQANSNPEQLSLPRE